MLRSPWKRTSHWLAAILLGISLLPPVATADAGLDATAADDVTAAAATATAPVLVSGFSHSFVIQPGGTLWAWGDNDYGQAGGRGWNAFEPALVPLLPAGVKAVAAGVGHSVAIGSDGAVWTWGANWAGQAGRLDTSTDYSPAKIKVSAATAVAAGGAHSVALLKSGTVQSWGGNDRGQLGNGQYEQSTGPVSVKGLSKVTAIASGEDHSLALKSDGTVWAWGANTEGELGDNTLTDRNEPIKVAGLPKIAAVAAGMTTSYALTADGTLWGWGGNEFGQLGNGTFNDQLVPVQLMAGVAQVAPGTAHTVVLKKDGTVWTWGDNYYGQLGFEGASSSQPVQVQNLDKVSAVVAGAGFTLVTKTNGAIYGWGANNVGQLGIGDLVQTTAQPILALAGVAITSPAEIEGMIRVTTTKVSFTGQTYPNATVAAVAEGGTARTATADTAGKFTLKDFTFPSGAETNLTFSATAPTGASSSIHIIPVYVDDQAPEVSGLYLSVIHPDGSDTTPDLTRNGNNYTGTVDNVTDIVLRAQVDEQFSKVTVTPAPKAVTSNLLDFEVTFGTLKKGANTVTVEVTDLVGKKSKVTLQLNYEAGPILQVTSPKGDVLSRGADKGKDTLPVTFSGSSDEPVASLEVIDTATGAPLDFETTVKTGSKWSATVAFPATDAGAWTVRLVATDAQGYVSAPSPTGADTRRIAIDPLAPEVGLWSPPEGLIFTDGDDEDLGVTKQKLLIAGEAFDEHSGIKQVTVGSSKVTPKKGSDPRYMAFSVPVSLKDQALTVIPISAEDLVGNKFGPGYVGAVMKTKINKLQASGKWTTSTDLLKVTGSTDPAINIGTTKEPEYVGIVEWRVFYRDLSATSVAASAEAVSAAGLPSDAKELKAMSQGVAARATASAQVGCWDPFKGTFSCNFDVSDLPDGNYKFYVRAYPPYEFPDLDIKEVTFTTKIKR